MTPTSTLAIVGYCVLALVVAYVSLRLIRLYKARNASSLPRPVSASSSQSISGWARSTAWGWAKWTMPWSRTTKATPTPTKAKGKAAKNLTVELLPVTALPPHPTSLPPTPPLVDLSSATPPSRPASAMKHHNIPHLSYPRPPSPHALLATTTPSKHRRSRSLGGVPVRRLSGGSSSNLRYANQVEVEMRDMGLRERDVIASASSREHLLIDFSSSSPHEGPGQEPRRISPAASDIGVLPAVLTRGGSVVNALALPLVDLGDEESGNDGWNWQGAKRSLEGFWSPSPRPLAEAKLVDLQSSPEDEDDELILPSFKGKLAVTAFASQQSPISVPNVAHITFSSSHIPLRLSKSESPSSQLVDIAPDDPFVDPPSSQSVLSTSSTVVSQDTDFVSHPLEGLMEAEIVIEHEDVEADASLLMQVDQDDAYVGHPEDLEVGAQDPFVDVESSTQEEASDEDIFHYPSPTVEKPLSAPVSPQSDDDDEEFHYPGAEDVLEALEPVHNQESLVSVSQESPTSPSEFVYPSEGTSAWSFDNENMDNDVDEDPWASAISAQSVVEYAEESARGEGSDLISFEFDEKLDEKSPGGSLLPLQREDEDEMPVLVLERSMLDVEGAGDEEEETDTTPRPTPSSTSVDLPEADSVSEEDAVPVTVHSPEPEADNETFSSETEEESADEKFPDPELLPLPELLLSTATIPETVDLVPAISILPCDQEDPASVSVAKAPAQTPTPPASPPAALSALRVLNLQPHILSSANSSPRLGVKHSFSGGRSLPPSPRTHVRNVDLLGTASIPSPISIKYSKSLPLMEPSPRVDGEEKENVSPALQRPLWSLRAADAPALGLKAEGSGPSPLVRRRALEREREDAVHEQGIEEKKEPQELETTLPVEQLPETEVGVEVEPPAGIKVSLSLPGSFPEPTAPAVQDAPTVDTVTTDAASATANANLALAALTLLASASSASSSSFTSTTTSTSSEDSSSTNVAQQPQQPRARLPTPRSPLDIALAMQLRPGLGAGADPAWMVRFLMAMYGWFGLLISGQGDF